jgi:hypothetical protein
LNNKLKELRARSPFTAARKAKEESQGTDDNTRRQRIAEFGRAASKARSLSSAAEFSVQRSLRGI